jgi:hypothetical protein
MYCGLANMIFFDDSPNPSRPEEYEEDIKLVVCTQSPQAILSRLDSEGFACFASESSACDEGDFLLACFLPSSIDSR